MLPSNPMCFGTLGALAPFAQVAVGRLYQRLLRSVPTRTAATARLITPAGIRLHNHAAGQSHNSHHSEELVPDASPQAKAQLADGLNKAPEHLKVDVKKRLRDFAKLPWEVAMTAEDAAKTLGIFLGAPNLEPASVLNLDKDQVHAILEATTNKGDKQLEKALFSHADNVTTRFFGPEIYYRGIVEFSNVCQNDCGYCGIRKHQHDVYRYTMPREEVVEVARWAFNNHLGNLMLQSGELNSPQRNQYIEDIVRGVRETTIAMDLEAQGKDPKILPEDTTNLGICVSLSVGELPTEQYERFYRAGARRYLLRIETSNPDLYSMLHPQDMSWHHRVNCLKELKKVGYMIGTGVMVGLPGQTLRDLAGDILFFKEIGANMIGMGPYITEPGTPVAEMWQQVFTDIDKKAHMKDMFELTTRMNALARVTIGNANISATTALQAIDPMGREIALRRGSNVLMPILTPTKYREHYQLYEGKPCITDSADECRKCLNARISMIGKKVKDNIWGDPPNFLKPIVGVEIPRSELGKVPGVSHGYHTVATSRGYATAAGPLPNVKDKAGFAYALGMELPKGPSTQKGSDVPRINIGVFGVMNAGKSTLMNRITRQETSIVDSTPGTTADVKVTMMELHDIGPVKLFDTAGIDEKGELGEKKRKKTLGTLKECDMAVVVVDLLRLQQAQGTLAEKLKWEHDLVDNMLKYQVVPMLLFNQKGLSGEAACNLVGECRKLLDPHSALLNLTMDLNDSKVNVPTLIANWLQDGATRSKKRPQVRALPEWSLRPDAVVFMNIPMDAETPSMRLLRPQALVQEEAIRYWATTVGYRMDLAKARSSNPAEVAEEKQRFMRALQPVIDHPGPKILVTDSQAMDIVHPWTLDASGNSLIPITTFSIAMIHRQSGGKLDLFVKGIETFKTVKPGDRLLVAEACNHNRITDICNDIGMVQIPNLIEGRCGKGVELEHAFGREYPELEDGSLQQFKLALHCGGCMIDHQKMRARISDMEEAGVPVTNYGLFLSYMHNPKGLSRVLEPWGLKVNID